MGRPNGSQNKRTREMVEYAEAEGRLSPAKAMIEYYLMNLDSFPRAKAAFPGMVALKMATRTKNLKHDLGAEAFAELDQKEFRKMVEYEVLEKLFPSMPRVVAMKEVASYCHSKMPALVSLDITDNRLAEKIAAAQNRLGNRLIDAVKNMPAPQPQEPRDVTPDAKPGSIAAVIGRAGQPS